MDNNPLFTEAFRLMVAGFSVIPCRKDKTPLISSVIPFRTIPADENQITKWWTDWPEACIGIITGRISGITVIDVDTYKPGAVDPGVFPETFTVRTGQGGLQLYYQYQEGFTISANKYEEYPHMDMRSDGGYVIAPPSVTDFIKDGKKAGGAYSVVKNIPFAPFPLGMFSKKKARKLMSQIGVPDGARNDSIASFIGRVLRTAKENEWETDVWPAVQIANRTYMPPLDDVKLRSTFESISRKEKESREGVTETYLPAITFGELIKTEFPPIRYTIEPFFEQGTVNMVSAPQSTWKSWLLFLFSYHIVTGTSFLDKFKTNKEKVMIVNEEDSLRLIQDRFNTLKITDPDLPIFFRVAQGAKLNNKFVEKLLAESKTNEITVIMFDSMRAMHNANENDSQEMQVIMDLFKKLAREGITVILNHHHRKKGLFNKQDDADATRGSSAINAAVSGHILLEEAKREEKTFIIVRHLKNKAGEKLEPFEIQIEKTENTLKFSYAGEFKAADQKMLETKDKLLGTLRPDAWVTLKELYNLSIGGVNTVRRALSVLTKEGLVICSNRKELLEKGLKITSEGHFREKLFSLSSTSEKELVMMEDDELLNF